MAPPTAPLGSPATTAASGMMVVRWPLLAAVSGEARAPPCVSRAAGPAGAMVVRAPFPRFGGVPAMAPPMAPLGRPATAAVPGVMVVRRPILTVVTGMARPSAPALLRANGAAEPVGAMGLARLERLPRMAAPLAAPFGAQKRRLEALGCGPQPLPRPRPLRPPAGGGASRVWSGPSDGAALAAGRPLGDSGAAEGELSGRGGGGPGHF